MKVNKGIASGAVIMIIFLVIAFTLMYREKNPDVFLKYGVKNTSFSEPNKDIDIANNITSTTTSSAKNISNKCSSLKEEECKNNSRCVGVFGSSSCIFYPNNGKLVCPEAVTADYVFRGCTE